MLIHSIYNVPRICINSSKNTMFRVESRSGQKCTSVPSNVIVNLEGQQLKVKGPLGELSRTYPRQLKIELDERGDLRLHKAIETKKAREIFFLFKRLTKYMVKGVLDGFERRLQMVGEGYTAALEGEVLLLRFGQSYVAKLPVPEDLKASVSDNTKIVISGIQKSSVDLFSEAVRRWKSPNPEKGKGVRYEVEVSRLVEESVASNK